MEILSKTFELKEAPNDEGRFEGYASVFDKTDSDSDIISKGAFGDSLATGRNIKMLWQHDRSQPIGVWESVREDAHGLYVRGRLIQEVQKGREALALLKAGALDSMSIGFRTLQAKGEGQVRRIEEVDLHEISLVTFPAMEAAKVVAVKSSDEIKTIRDFEKTLRDAGFSQTEAKAIAAKGFNGLSNCRDGLLDEQSENFTNYFYSLVRLKETMNHA